MKNYIAGLLLLGLVIASIFFWQVWQNNREIDSVSNENIQHHFERSVSWLNSNYAAVENTDNPILWWMIKQAALTSQNKTLKSIYSTYKKDHLDTQPANLSTPMFDKFYRPRIPDIRAFSKLADYQTFFFYALSCDSDLGSEPVIQKQLSAEFCTMHYLHPRCITHQLMGLRFMQRYQCGYDDIVNSAINELSDIVVAELSWDFRVGDAYIQRVLMLLDTGNREKIKPVWINNILNAQNEDGSWDDLDPLLYLGNGYAFGYTSMLPKVTKPAADFHATAQAVWLLSLLLNDSNTP